MHTPAPQTIPYSLNIRGKLLPLQPAAVMGIINLSLDSFYAESRVTNERILLQQAEKMLAEGAAILDVGAVSTRPGAPDVSVADEQALLVPAISSLRRAFPDAVLSVDTFRAATAQAAAHAGADIINDVQGGQADADMFETVARNGLAYVLMHSRGTPRTMQSLNTYTDLLAELIAFFQERIYTLKSMGVHQVIIDPGFGFAKDTGQNFRILENLSCLSVLDRPILAGLSRKRSIWHTLGISPAEALNGTTVLNTVALRQGASVLRVHDVRPAVEAVKLCAELDKNR